MTESIPSIEITDDAHASSIGSPQHKVNSGDALDGAEMGAETVVGFVQGSFCKEMEFKIRQQRWKSIGIMDVSDSAVIVCDAKRVRWSECSIWKQRLIQSLLTNASHRAEDGVGYDLNIRDLGEPGPDREAGVTVDHRGMWAQNRVRGPVSAGNETIKIILLNGLINRHGTILMATVVIRKGKMFPAMALNEIAEENSDCMVAAGP
jgi:hypothetical protein